MKQDSYRFLETLQEATFRHLGIEPVVYNEELFDNVTKKVNKSRESFSEIYGEINSPHQEKLYIMIGKNLKKIFQNPC